MRKIFVLGLLIALGLGPMAVERSRAESGGTTPATQIGNPQDKQTGFFRDGVSHAGISAIDTTNLESLIADATNKEFEINGRGCVAIMAVFQNSGQTCKGRFVTYNKIVGTTEKFVTSISDEYTLTGVGFFRTGSVNSVSVAGYYSKPQPFETYGAYYGKWIVTQVPGSGWVKFAGASW